MKSFFTTKVVKRGGSMYLLIPSSTVKDVSLKDGERVHVIIETTRDEH